MDDNKQSQGTVDKPEVQEKLAEMKQESQTLAERSKTVDERLDRLTQQRAAEQPEPMPSSNQTTEEGRPEALASDQPNLPDTASDRTKEQFNKLLEENRRLKEERRKQAGNSVFDALRPNMSGSSDQSMFGNNIQIPNPIPDYVGQEGVDVDGLNKALRSANDRASLAEIEAAKARQLAQQVDERQQVREAHRDFPELDPTNAEKFDPNFYDLVALKIAKSGMRLGLSQAAAEVRTTYTPSGSVNLDKVRDEAVSQFKDNQAKRDQLPLSNSQGQPRIVETSKELRERTRKGDAYALDERLRKLGLIK